MIDLAEMQFLQGFSDVWPTANVHDYWKHALVTSVLKREEALPCLTSASQFPLYRVSKDCMYLVFWRSWFNTWKAILFHHRSLLVLGRVTEPHIASPNEFLRWTLPVLLVTLSSPCFWMLKGTFHALPHNVVLQSLRQVGVSRPTL